MHYVVGTIKPEDTTLVSLVELNDDGSATGLEFREERLSIKGTLAVNDTGQLILAGYEPDKKLEPVDTGATE